MEQGESSEAGLRRSQRPKRRRDFGDELGEDDGEYYGDDYDGQEGDEEFDDEVDSEFDEDEDDSDQEGRRASSRPRSQQQQQQQQQAQRSTTTALTDARLVVDYGALTREYEQRGGAADPFPDYADTILKLTRKANQKLRKSRKKAVADADDEMGKKKRKKKGLGEQQLAVFGEAQALYMRGELSAALASVNHLLQLKYYSHEVAALRSRIAEEMGHTHAAAEWCLVASRFGKTDRSLWKKAGQLYMELGPPGYFKAQYCFARAFKLDGDDYEALSERALVYSLDNKVERAVQLYEQVLKLKKPVPHPEVFLIRMAEDCFREKKLWPKGTSGVYQVLCRVLGSAFMAKQTKAFPTIKPTAAHANHKPSKEMGYAFDACSVYCRHLMSPHLRKYEQAAAVIEVCEDFITRLRNQESRFQPAEGETVSLPLDLAVQYGICQLHLDKLDPALRCFKPLQERDPNDPAVVSLLEDVAAAYVAKNMHFRAIGLLRRVDVNAVRAEWVVVPVDTPSEGPLDPTQPPPPPRTVHQQVHRYTRIHSVHTSLRLQLKVAHSYMAAKKHEQAEELALKVIAACQDPEQPMDDHKLAALREATVLWGHCARALSRPIDIMQNVLDAVTFHVQQLVFRLPDAPLPDPSEPLPPAPLEAELNGQIIQIIHPPASASASGSGPIAHHQEGQPPPPPTDPLPESSHPPPMPTPMQPYEPPGAEALVSATPLPPPVPAPLPAPTNPEPTNPEPTISNPNMPLIIVAPPPAAAPLAPPLPPPPLEAPPMPQPPLSQDDELLRAARERLERGRTTGDVQAPQAEASSSRPARRKRWQTLSLGVADDPTTMPPSHLEFQLLLEFGLLSRSLNVLEDFFTACLALVELAVFQSKNRFRESSKSRMLRLEEQGSAPPVELPPVPQQNTIHTILTRSWERTHMQNDVEAFVRDRAFSHTVKTMLGEPRLFEAVRAIIDTCMEARMVREASMVLKQVMKRKKLLSDEHIKELSQRGLASGIALTDGQPLHVQLSADVSSGGGAGRRRPISGADIYVSIRNALQNAQTEPHSVELLNSLCRMLHQVRLEGSTRLYIRRLAQNNPTSAPLGLMAGHNFASSRNFKRALSSYLDALRVVPQDPLLSLCVAVLLLRALCHKKMQDRHGCIVKGMAFLEQYASFRDKDEPLSPDEKKALSPEMCEHMRLAVRQEVMYNQGRAFHQAGLTHLAIHYYGDALALFDAHRPAFEALGAKAHVTREAAHNLAMVYAESGNRPGAAAIATKYLSID